LPLSLSIITRCMVPTCSPFERYTGVFSTLSLAMSEEVSRTFVGCVVTAIVFLRCFAEKPQPNAVSQRQRGTSYCCCIFKNVGAPLLLFSKEL
jgi:hypothetical protein